jgi:hypothetical protein
MSTAVQDNGKKSVAFKDMTPEQKAEYYAKLKAKREARKENKFVAPKGADYVDSAGKYTFTINPQGYDPKLHADFSEEDFAREDIWLDYRAGLLETRAAKLRAEAESVRKGGPRLKGAAKKLANYQAKFEALKASLIAEGVDVDAVLASIQQPKVVS